VCVVRGGGGVDYSPLPSRFPLSLSPSLSLISVSLKTNPQTKQKNKKLTKKEETKGP
jgi:hypothetical protein